MNKYALNKIGILFLLILGLAFNGCSTKEKEKVGTQVSQQDTQLYTCGMHPNVIQEGPGNCPICSMKLTPLGGTSSVTSAQVSDASQEKGEKKILYWRAPMDPTYISPKQGKSPMGMDLIPVYEGEEAFGSTVKINPVIEQNIGIRVAPVTRRDLSQEIRTIGRVDYDESKVAHVHTKFTGWIEKTLVNTTGQSVREGEILLYIYSPQLVTAQEEYLEALVNLENVSETVSPTTYQNFKSILASTRRRLEYFDVSQQQIEELDSTGEVQKTLAIESPFSGIVVDKHAIDGMEIKSGMRLYTIADLSEIWVYADIYEYEVPWVKVGQPAIMTLSYEPGKQYVGQVQYIYPYLEEKTRTIKVRISFPNPNLELKPGMYSNVAIESSPVKDVIAVPMEAVLFSGTRNLVFVTLGEGRFAPRDVTIGIESGDGYYEIEEGLAQGETVVTSAQFLLDSESKLQESIAKMLASRKNITTTSDKPDVKNESATVTEHKHDMKDKEEMQEMDHSNHDQELQSEPESASSVNFGTIEDGLLNYYTCPMESHSFVKMKEPGSCPECGMVLVERSESYNPEKMYYTCPMPEHSYVITEEPGSCPVCGMSLIVPSN